jgi:hypothetical protein
MGVVVVLNDSSYKGTEITMINELLVLFSPSWPWYARISSNHCYITSRYRLTQREHYCLHGERRVVNKAITLSA